MHDLREGLPVRAESVDAEIVEAKAYNKHWWTSAWRSARITLRIESTSRILIGGGIAILILAALWIGGYHDLAIDELILRAAASVVILSLLPAVVLFHALRYPPQKHQSAIATIGSLKDTIAGHKAEQEAIDELSRLRAEGMSLAFQKVTDAEFDGWKMKFKDWTGRVSKILGDKFSTTEQIGFGFATTPITVTYDISTGPEHNSQLNTFRARLDRLQTIIDQRQGALLNR